MTSSFTKRSYLLNFFLLWLMYGSIYGLGGMLLDTSTQKAAEFFSGSLYGHPFVEVGLMDFVGINLVYKWLYLHFPLINWYPLSCLLFITLLSISLICEILRTIYLPRKLPLSLQFICTSIILIMIQMHLLTLEHNRTSFLFSIIGLWLIIQSSPLSLKYFIGILLFSMGIVFRPEAAIGTLIIACPLFILFRKPYLFQDLKKLILPIAILCIWSTALYLKVTYSDNYLYSMEPDVEYEIFDKGNIVPISTMPNAVDSAKYQMVANWLLCDQDVISPTFLRSLIQQGKQSKLSYLFTKNNNGIPFFSKLRQVLETYDFLFLTLAIITLACAYRKPYQSFFKLLLYGIYILSIIVFIIGGFGTDIRINYLESVMTVAILALILIPGITISIQKRIWHYPILFALCVIAYFYYASKYQVIVKEKAQISENEKMLRLVNSEKENYLIYMGNYIFLNHFQNPLIIRPIFQGKKVINFRFAQYYNTDSYQQILSQYLHIDQPSYRDILHFIQKKTDDIIIISNPHVLQTWLDYNRIVYHISFRVKKIKPHFNSEDDFMYKINM